MQSLPSMRRKVQPSKPVRMGRNKVQPYPQAQAMREARLRAEVEALMRRCECRF